MKRKSKIGLICLFFLFKVSISLSQIDTVFWFAAPWITPGHDTKVPVALRIATFNNPLTTIRIRQPAAMFDTTFTLGPNQAYSKFLNWLILSGNLENFPANTVHNRGLKISSDFPITVIYDVVTPTPNNPETFSIKGQNGLGTEFVCPFQTNGDNGGYIPQPKSQICIVATDDNTVVWITPKCAVVGHPAGVSYSVGLNYGQSYNVENISPFTSVPGNNLSGTIIVSNKPIAVTVADDSVKGFNGCRDLMGDQLVPVDIVGTDYIIVKGRMYSDQFEGAYVVATENLTQVNINDGTAQPPVYLNKGDTYFYKTMQPRTYVNASKNVYLLHATGFGCELGEAVLPPLNCAGSDIITFTRNNTDSFFINILCRQSLINTFTLSNTYTVWPIPSSTFALLPATSALPGGPYYSTQIPLTTTVVPSGTVATSVLNLQDSVFAMGIFNGTKGGGTLYHYMSSFLRKTVITTPTISPVCVGATNTIALTATVSGSSRTGTWSAYGITANSQTTSIAGVFTPTSLTDNRNAVYTLSGTDTLLTAIVFSLTSTGSCKPVGKTFTVQINPRPRIISLPTVPTICKNNLSPFPLAGSVYTNASGGGWSGGIGGAFSSPGPNPTYTPSIADANNGFIVFTFSITPYPNTGCIGASKTLTVNFTNPPTLNLANANACTNTQSLNLTSSVGGSTVVPIWNTPLGTGIFVPSNTTVNPTFVFSPGAYTLSTIVLTVTIPQSGACNSFSQTMQITMNPKPVVSVPSDFTVCANAGGISVTGTVTGSASQGIWSTPNGSGSFFQIPPSNSAIYTLGQNDTLSGNVTFVFTSTNSIVCPISEKDSLHIAVLKAPVVTVNSGSVVCKNAPINLNGQVSGYTSTGIWSSSGSGAFTPTNTALGGQYLPSPGDVANGSVVITLSSTGDFGCPATSKSFTASFIPSPLASFNTSPKLCKNVGVLFSNNSSPNGTDSLTYAWDFGDASPLSIATEPLHTYTNIGSFVVTLTVTGISAFDVNCPDTVSHRILINTTPTANFDFLNGCKNLETQFRDSSSVFGGSIVSWSWLFGDNSPVATIKNPPHTYTASGTFNVQLTVTSNNLCTESVSKLVTINPSPVAEFGLTNNPAVAQEPIYFSDFSTPTSSIRHWFWDFGDEGSAVQQGPSHIFENAGIYLVTLTVTDDAGCSDTITKPIEITLLPQVPTAFSPNKDGHNDVLLVKGGPFQNITFKVYNSWGELLFETSDQKIGWDGTKNGIEQPVGAYVWTLVVDMYNNRQVKKNGDVTIMR